MIVTLFRYILCLAMGFSQTTLAKDIIRVTQSAWNDEELGVVGLALQASMEKFGPYTIRTFGDVVQSRAAEELSLGRNIDITWFATTPEREAQLRPIRIPIDMGLLGYRVCIINPYDQEKFNSIYTLNDWLASKRSIGQEKHWADVAILKYNKIRVVKGNSYKSLFNMLRNQRFDCFSRSILEVNQELSRVENKYLALEKNILFFYPIPTFVFVNKNNHKLAKRVDFGLKKIIKNGKFHQHMMEKRLLGIENLNLRKRRLIPLHNPTLTEETQEAILRNPLWLDLKKL